MTWPRCVVPGCDTHCELYGMCERHRLLLPAPLRFDYQRTWLDFGSHHVSSPEHLRVRRVAVALLTLPRSLSEQLTTEQIGLFKSCIVLGCVDAATEAASWCSRHWGLLPDALRRSYRQALDWWILDSLHAANYFRDARNEVRRYLQSLANDAGEAEG